MTLAQDKFLQTGTGAVNRTVESKLNDFVSVKDFGAVGDGVTDDTAAIQDAIDAIASGTTDTIGGRSLFLPAGTYSVSTTITLSLNSHVRLYGEGANTSVIQWDGGASVAVSLSGTSSGDNRQFSMRDLSIRNNTTGTIGFEGNFVAFSGTIENVRIDHFSDKNFWIENFENGVMINCLSEMGRVGLSGSLTNTGFWFENTNGVVLIGCQVHNYGNHTGNSPDGILRSAFTGSVGFFFNNCDSLVTQNIVPEGGTTNLDVGVWVEETIDRVTPTGGVSLHGYWERCDLAVKLRGFDNDTPLRHIVLGGKISGTITKGVLGENYVDNFAIANGGMRVSVTGSNPFVFDSTCSNIDIGNNSYGTGITISDSSEYPPVKPSTWYYHNTPISAYSASAITANTTAADYAVASLSGDYRRPLAALLNLKLSATTAGSSGRVTIRVFPTGGSASEYHDFYTNFNAIDSGDTTANRLVVPCNSSGQIRYQIFVTSAVSWSVVVDIDEIGVMY